MGAAVSGVRSESKEGASEYLAQIGRKWRSKWFVRLFGLGSAGKGRCFFGLAQAGVGKEGVHRRLSRAVIGDGGRKISAADDMVRTRREISITNGNVRAVFRLTMTGDAILLLFFFFSLDALRLDVINGTVFALLTSTFGAGG